MDNLKIGSLIENAEQQRDAIHVAVYPVTARERLSPGQHIGPVMNDGTVGACPSGPFGIVDPFLPAPVFPGDRFWMFLYPNTVTSLRHEWTHPKFPVVLQQPALQSEKWMRGYASEISMTYSGLLQAARRYLENDERLCGGEELDGVRTDSDFWEHYAAITGIEKPEHKYGDFFSCAC